MQTFETGAEVRRTVENWRGSGRRVAFVPTMGALHDGHLALVRRAGESADRTVASVFVNPTQFGPGEDFERYPRSPEQDAGLLAGAGCDVLFLPSVEEIYPPGHTTFIDLGEPALGLEGDHRPGHFRGVATVVTALFQLVRPDVAVFGEKDAQQLAVLRRVTRDLHLGVEIVGHPTVRESDGLAMSSRNAYLSPEDRRSAPVLHRALTAAVEALRQGERNADALRQTMAEILAASPRVEVEYAEVVHAETFRPARQVNGPIVLPIAARLGATRLIDNLRFEPPN
ncbi:MAG: pantoate--beta-alanine ligase [Acidobacteriota bacterium]